MAHTLHFHGNIALNWCECMVGKSTLCLVLDWVGSVNGITSNRVARLIKMVKKISFRHQQEGIDPPSGERLTNYGQNSPQRGKVVKVFRFAKPAVRNQKSATHTKAHDFEHKTDFEYKMIIVMYHPKSF